MNLKFRFGRLIFVRIILAIFAYLVNGYLERIAREKADRERRESIERSVKASVSKMVSQYDALSDWKEKLSQTKSLKTEKILSIDLERLWLVERPILFVGSIQDISTIDGQSYR
jgi:Tfp pilus assembly protein PilO